MTFKLTKHGLSYSIKSDLRSFSKIKFVQIGAPAPIPYVILRMEIEKKCLLFIKALPRYPRYEKKFQWTLLRPMRSDDVFFRNF